MVKKISVLLVFICSLSVVLHARDQRVLHRFFPAEKTWPAYVPSKTITPFPANRTAQVPATEFNEAVELNNQGLDAMRSNDFVQAARLFTAASKLAPSETGFLSNRLLALRRIKGREHQAIEVARMLLGTDQNYAQAAYVAGLIYLNELEDAQEAILYLRYAHQIDADNADVGVALAHAYEQAGYNNDAFALLQKFANRAGDDPYPRYLLGLQHLERNDYNAAIAAFNSARIYDDKGYVHDMLIRARYYAGQLANLAAEARSVLNRFPNVANKESIERILFSLEPADFRFVETIKLTISRPSAIERLDFLVRPIPEVSGHQETMLVSCEVFSRQNEFRLNADERESDGRYRISLPNGALAPEIRLRLTYRIKTRPLLATQRVADSIKHPDLKSLMADPLLSLDNPALESLANQLVRMPGNYVQNAVKAVADGLSYKENFEDYSVEWALANPDLVDCTEYSRLLAALCLKKGIPARMVTGFLVKPEFMNKPTSVGHAWTEVFFERRGWVPVDATLQQSMHWAYFGNLLSDQILFDMDNRQNKPRVSIDFVSSQPDVRADLSNSYIISKWR